MPSHKEYFAHGEHNENACLLLHGTNQFPDWTITTAFYSAMHFTLSAIFPFKHKVGDKEQTFNDDNDWIKHKSYSQDNKHKLIKDLVSKHCSAIYDKYDWLLSTSWNARYHNHIHPTQIVDRAITYLRDIKKYSQKINGSK